MIVLDKSTVALIFGLERYRQILVKLTDATNTAKVRYANTSNNWHSIFALVYIDETVYGVSKEEYELYPLIVSDSEVCISIDAYPYEFVWNNTLSESVKEHNYNFADEARILGYCSLESDGYICLCI